MAPHIANWRGGPPRSELEQLCSGFEECIGFDFSKNGDWADLYFSSASARDNIAMPGGFKQWGEGQCKSNCRIATIKEDSNYECWVKFGSGMCHFRTPVA